MTEGEKGRGGEGEPGELNRLCAHFDSFFDSHWLGTCFSVVSRPANSTSEQALIFEAMAAVLSTSRNTTSKTTLVHRRHSQRGCTEGPFQSTFMLAWNKYTALCA